MTFSPHYKLNSNITTSLERINRARERIAQLPLTAPVLKSLRETARLATTHYSTKIEGNRLDFQEVEKVILKDQKIRGRIRDEAEVRGYYAALTQIERWAEKKAVLTEESIKLIHSLVMETSKTKKGHTPSPYRDGQNVIYDGHTRHIVYLPPEAPDVPTLMHELFEWIEKQEEKLPTPLLAAIAHYQYVTIHPYYDGNGRTARLMATYLLHRGGYDLKGLYSLEEYYARNLDAYYSALDRGPSHNYYVGRVDADITPWIEYFITGMAVACENVLKRMDLGAMHSPKDQSALIRTLTPQQRNVLSLFLKTPHVTTKNVAECLGISRTATLHLCMEWVNSGFLEIVDVSRRIRKYRLGDQFRVLADKT